MVAIPFGSFKPSIGLVYQTDATATSTNGDISFSANVLPGDLAILCSQHSSGSADGTPSGWTICKGETSAVNTSTYYFNTYYRIVQSGDASSALATISGINRRRHMAIFRRPALVNTVVLSTWNGQSVSGVPTQQTVSASGVSVPVIVIGVSTTGSLSGSATLSSSPALDGIIDIGTDDRYFGYKIYASSPANHTFDSTDPGSGITGLHSGYVRITS